jgi:transcriptional regulator with XRE-family HTH domain
MTVETPDRTRVARELRAELARRDIKGAELARMLGRPQQTVNRWIKTGQGLDIDALGEISRATDISVLELLRAAAFRCTPPQDLQVPSQQARGSASIGAHYPGPFRRASDLRR